MPQTPGTVVAPADARVLLGSLQPQSSLCIKGKFFAFDELLGSHQQRWLEAFAGGDVAICRLTPEQYHYTHCPVSGIVRDIYALPGAYHSCHPAATVALATPLSKNRRVVTIIDTDVPHGSSVGLVAMIEVVALMGSSRTDLAPPVGVPARRLSRQWQDLRVPGDGRHRGTLCRVSRLVFCQRPYACGAPDGGSQGAVGPALRCPPREPVVWHFYLLRL